MYSRQMKNPPAEEYLAKQLGALAPRYIDNPRQSLRVNFSDDQAQNSVNVGLATLLSPSFDVTHERIKRGSMSASRDTVRFRSESHCSALGTAPRVRKSKAKFDLMLDNYEILEGNFDYVRLPIIYLSHDKAYQNWAEQYFRKYKSIHQNMKRFMLRSNETVEEESIFVKRFDAECNKTYLSLNLFEGNVEVTPLQAQNLPDSRNAVFVRISYGDKVIIFTF